VSALEIELTAAAVGTTLGGSLAGLSFRVHDVTRRQANNINARARIVSDVDRIDVVCGE
jgi:hypothetical protein